MVFQHQLLLPSLGISYIEKHFNLDDLITADSSFSINPNQLKELSDTISYLFQILKKENLIRKKNIFLRRSIFSSKNIKKNEIITKDKINTLRPKLEYVLLNFLKF